MVISVVLLVEVIVFVCILLMCFVFSRVIFMFMVGFFER